MNILILVAIALVVVVVVGGLLSLIYREVHELIDYGFDVFPIFMILLSLAGLLVIVGITIDLIQ